MKENNASGLIRVSIVEDDRAIREGLSMLLNGSSGFSCVGKYFSVEDALRERSGDSPHVLLLDINLPGISGSDGVPVLKDKYPEAQVLMLTVYEEQEHIFDALCNGAAGYLLKKTPPAKLLEAISEAHHGGAPMSPEIARKVIALFQKTGPREKIEEPLTPQEIRLLKLLAQGYSYRDSANELNISVNTVRDYIRSIYEKLHVHSKSEAVSKALRSRIIS